MWHIQLAMWSIHSCTTTSVHLHTTKQKKNVFYGQVEAAHFCWDHEEGSWTMKLDIHTMNDGGASFTSSTACSFGHVKEVPGAPMLCNTLEQATCRVNGAQLQQHHAGSQFWQIIHWGQQEEADVLIWSEPDRTSLAVPLVMYNLGPSQETWSRAGASSCYCATVIKPASCTCLYNLVPQGKQPSWPSPEITFALTNEACKSL